MRKNKLLHLFTNYINNIDAIQNLIIKVWTTVIYNVINYNTLFVKLYILKL